MEMITCQGDSRLLNQFSRLAPKKCVENSVTKMHSYTVLKGLKRELLCSFYFESQSIPCDICRQYVLNGSFD